MGLWDVEGLMAKTPETLLNLFILGDSDYEIRAGKNMRTHMKYGRQCLIKLVKMKEEPNASDLERQLTTLLSKFNEITCSQKHVNIVLSMSDPII
jgi:hypothetical protein